jgi:hypothetical protein
MTMSETRSIFARYYADETFIDRYANNGKGAVDVLIPVLYTNELWRKNLTSIYREVPVRRLLLGDAGCKDDTLVIARQFPRVEIFDHSSYNSLGYSIKELIKSVESEWFLYLHSDVYLPDGWFDAMSKHQADYDWFGCPMRITALLEYPLVDKVRPYAGTQMGRKKAFLEGLERIEDDYVYRQEDWVFARIVEDSGYRHGRIEDTFHWHQMMPRHYSDSRRVRTFTRVKIDAAMTREEEVYTADTQLRGTVKYLRPDFNQVSGARQNLLDLQKLGAIDLDEFYGWVERTNPDWLPVLKVSDGPGRYQYLAEMSLYIAQMPLFLAYVVVRQAALMLAGRLRFRMMRPSQRSGISRAVDAVQRFDRRVLGAMANRSRALASLAAQVTKQLLK